MSNHRWESFQSYDQILAEAHRLTELPTWVHYASLADTALTRFPDECPTLTAFWQDTKPAFSLPTASNYMSALKVWRGTSRTVRNKIQHVTTYLAVARDERWNPRMSSIEVGRLVIEASKSNPYIFKAGLTATIRSLQMLQKNPNLLKTVSDERLAQVYVADKELLEYLVTEGRKRVLKQQKGAA